MNPGFSRVRMPALGALFALVACLPAAAAEITLSAGAGEVDITPDPLMTNYYSKHRPFGVVHDPLHVRALVIGDGTTKVAFVVWELLDTRESAVAKIRQEVEKATGIPDGRIIINANHSHSALRSPRFGEPATERGHQNDPQYQAWIDAHEKDPLYRRWLEEFPGRCVEAVRTAEANRRPVTIRLGRASAGEWIFNRRPIKSDGTVQGMLRPRDPYSLPNGLRFGRVDPTLTTLQFVGQDSRPVATLMHFACHSVGIYSDHDGVSADWSAPVLRRLKEDSGGAPAIFIQGCAGDIVPARRGLEAITAMGRGMGERAVTATRNSIALPAAPIQHHRAVVGLPLTPPAREAAGTDFVPAEIHVVAIGPLALVTLPGEPLIQLGFSIQERSPFPHTFVLGYANGRSGGYVGMPGDKAKGAYEMGPVGRATDEAGQLMIDTAVRLLNEISAPPPAAASKKG